MATVLVADQCEIPGDVATLDAFRRWARSPAFPSLGRIDWVASCIEVDMSPEDIFTHGTVKSEIVRVVGTLAKPRGMHLFTGETRVSADVADLSAEPDVVVTSEAAIEVGRVRLGDRFGPGRCLSLSRVRQRRTTIIEAQPLVTCSRCSSLRVSQSSRDNRPVERIRELRHHFAIQDRRPTLREFPFLYRQ